MNLVPLNCALRMATIVNIMLCVFYHNIFKIIQIIHKYIFAVKSQKYKQNYNLPWQLPHLDMQLYTQCVSLNPHNHHMV